MTERDDRPDAVSAADRRALRTAKRALRHAVLTRRASRSPQTRAGRDHARTLRLQDLVGERAGPQLEVAGYLSTAEEPGTLEMVSWLHTLQSSVWLPVLGTGAAGVGAIRWGRYRGADRLRLGRHGIAEPDGSAARADAIAGCELIIVAGLAGDVAGGRLGRGSGWYDRALPHAPTAISVLLLDDDEVLEEIPVEPTDVPVDVIITESRTIVCRASDPVP